MLVAHICDTLAPLAEDTGLSLEIDIAPNVIAPGDRDELARVIENLIENAIKYGRPDGNASGRIRVTLAVTGHEAIFSVQDNGPGIASEHIPRLTERFYRVDAGKSRAKGGTGLGLAIVKHIVLRHRGKLTIELGRAWARGFACSSPACGRTPRLIKYGKRSLIAIGIENLTLFPHFPQSAVTKAQPPSRIIVPSRKVSDAS